MSDLDGKDIEYVRREKQGYSLGEGSHLGLLEAAWVSACCARTGAVGPLG